jgi:hypothetical protein
MWSLEHNRQPAIKHGHNLCEAILDNVQEDMAGLKVALLTCVLQSYPHFHCQYVNISWHLTITCFHGRLMQ